MRGAITVAADQPTLIVDAVRELLAELTSANGIRNEDVISAYFTATHDLTSEFPAKGARAFGWHEVPLLCAVEIPVDGAIPHCIRVMLHVEVADGRRLQPAYLREARVLRPDVVGGGS